MLLERRRNTTRVVVEEAMQLRGGQRKAHDSEDARRPVSVLER